MWQTYAPRGRNKYRASPLPMDKWQLQLYQGFHKLETHSQHLCTKNIADSVYLPMIECTAALFAVPIDLGSGCGISTA